jgi:hypothetical protein
MSSPYSKLGPFNTAPIRLQALRQKAMAQNGKTWRDVRYYRLSEHVGMHGYAMDGKAYSYSDKREFRNERFADEVVRLNHTGWFGDTEHGEKLHRGIVGSLPHGKFIAGYFQDDNEERIYIHETFDDESDAARMADEHARIAAEKEDEYSQKWHEAMRLDDLIEGKKADVLECRERLHNSIQWSMESIIDSRTWHRFIDDRAQAIEDAKEIIADIRAFQRERDALKVD